MKAVAQPFPIPEVVDPRLPLEIAERVWWVGHVQDDPFQCHVYLIEHGDQSVLIDPGSRITFPHTLKKIEQIIPFNQIRYFICHHQDPDIAAALPHIDGLVERPDAVIVTHWRAQMLLRHYDLKIPFWNVEEHGWKLDLGGRELKFVFTPYAHFPGAFCTFDRRTGTLFSSDLFGGMGEPFDLFARDKSHFDRLRPFHEHYIPSRDILRYALQGLQRLPLKLIAPQHGSIIPAPLIKPLIRKLGGLECGLYLLSREHSDIQRLSALNEALRDMTRVLMRHRDFNDTAARLTEIARHILPLKQLFFFVASGVGEVLQLTPENRYRGVPVPTPQPVTQVLGAYRHDWYERHPRGFIQLDEPCDAACSSCHGLLMPLFSPDTNRAQAVAVCCLDRPLVNESELETVLEHLSMPLGVALEREALFRMQELKRQELYERSVRDPLTGLFTRFYMEDMVRRLFAIGERNSSTSVGLILLDVDHFKRINDTYGHLRGDRVLQAIASQLLQHVRSGDLAVRLGGEEFTLFLTDNHLDGVMGFAERLRQDIAQLEFGPELAGRKVTVSLGVAMHRQGETLECFLDRADAAMYRAKREGRNRICLAES